MLPLSIMSRFFYRRRIDAHHHHELGEPTPHAPAVDVTNIDDLDKGGKVNGGKVNGGFKYDVKYEKCDVALDVWKGATDNDSCPV